MSLSLHRELKSTNTVPIVVAGVMAREGKCETVKQMGHALNAAMNGSNRLLSNPRNRVTAEVVKLVLVSDITLTIKY